MLSKNNYKEKLRKMEPRKNRYSIRKFTVGAASVLIGFFLAGFGQNQTVKADTTKDVTPDEGEQTPHEATTSKALTNGTEGNKVVVQETSDKKLSEIAAKNVAAKEQTTTANKDKETRETQVVKSDNAPKTLQVKTAAVKTNDAKTSDAKVTAVSAAKTVTVADVKKQYADFEDQLKSGKLTKDEQTAEVNKLTENISKLSAADQQALGNLNLDATSTQSQNASDWTSLINAVENKNVDTINLTDNITVSGPTGNLGQPNPLVNKSHLVLNDEGIARTLTINGNGNTIDFGGYYLDVGNDTQTDANPNWNVTFKNLTVKADDSLSNQNAPLTLSSINANNQKNTTVTFDGVNSDVKGRYGVITGHNNGNLSVNIGSEYYHLILKGTNNIQSEGYTGNLTPGDDGDALSAGYITVEDGTTTVTQNQTSSYNLQYGGATVRVAQPDVSNNGVVSQYSLDIKNGATLSLNGGKDVKGIVVANATTGTVNVDGTLNMNMGEGHSIAILAGNLNVGKTGDLDVQTKQVQTGGRSIMNFDGGQYGVLSIGVGYPANTTNQDQNLINDNGTIKIVRTATADSLSPLISMGSGSAGILKGNFTVNVNPGATLDLQDSTQQKDLGMIYVSGSSVKSFVNFNAPKYVNLQRLSTLPVVNKTSTSNLIYLEGQPNGVTITQSPVAQWTNNNMSANPDYTWILESASSMNNWGTNADTGFTAAGQSSPQNKTGNLQFMYSNGSVTLAPTQGGLNQYSYNGSQTVSASSPQGIIVQGTNGASYYTPYLNQFLNNFNYWRPQRLAMGSELLSKPDIVNDATKYQPVVKTIDGNTKQTLADLNAKDGISGLLEQTGVDENGKPIYNTINDLTPIKTVDWYNSSDEATWKKLMGDEAVPTNPTGDLKTTDKSAWAKVTYTDGSIDFANIPLNITEPMVGLYTPSYNPVSVEQGQSATDEPTFTDADNKATTVPTGTTFTAGTDTPDWAKIDPSTGTVTVTPDTAVTPGAYNIPVTVTYSDKSTDETTVPVIVTKAGQTVTWGDNGAVVTTVDTSKLNAHETTENSQVLNADGAVTAEGYELKDGKLSTTATPITIDPSTVSWTTAPDTNVETATAAGKQIENNTIKIDLTNNAEAKNILGSKNGVVTTNPFTIDAKGAGAKNVTTPVNVKLDSDLTSEQFGQLVDNNIPTDEIASTTWATKPDAKGQGGVIKITFTDKDAQGNPTYLNVAIPASSIKITNGTDADNYNPEGQNVSTKVGEAPKAKEGIKNTGDLPDGTKYTWKTEPDIKTPGEKPAVVVVTYPDGSKDEVPTKVIVDANPEVKPITTTVNGKPDAKEGITNLNNGGTSPVQGYPSGATWTKAPDTSKPGTTNGTATVTYPDGTTQTVTIPVTVPGDEVDPGGDVIHYGSNQTMTQFHADPVNIHKTSENNTPSAQASGFNTIIYHYDWDGTSGNGNYRKSTTYKLNADGTEFVNTADPNDKFAASDITYSWQKGYEPNTNFGDDTASTLYKLADGSVNPAEQTGQGDNLPGNSKYRYDFTVSNDAVSMLGLGFGTFKSWSNVYFNFYGAKSGDALTFKQNSDISNLTQDQYRQLIDVTDLGANGWNGTDINPNAPQVLAYVPGTDATKTFSMIWAPNSQPSTATIANGVAGTVRILFNDGTYLDVPAKINVIKDDNAGTGDHDATEFTQKIVYTYNGHEVAYTTIDNIAKGSSLTADQLKNTIDSNVPSNYTIATNFTYPSAINNITATPAVINVPLTLKADATFNANGQIVYQTADGKQVGTGAQIKSKIGDTLTAGLLRDLANQNVPAGYTIAQYPNSFNVTANNFTVPVIVDKSTSVTMTYDFYSTVTIDKPDGTSTTEPQQHLTFTYQGVPTDADVDVEFKDVSIPSFEGYTPEVSITAPLSDIPMATLKQGPDGKWTLKLPKPILSCPIYNYTISYKKSDDNVTPIPYDPTNKDMNKEVTRTIEVYKPGTTTPEIVKQTVHFVRGGIGQNAGSKDESGNVTWTDWTVADETNKSTGASKGAWKQYDVAQIKDYTSTVDGKNAKTVAANNDVTATTSDVTVVVAYSQTLQPTDPSINPNKPGENSDMFAHPTRTINVVDPVTGQTNPTIQTVWFGRTKTVSTDPNVKPTYGDWQLGKVENNKFTATPDAKAQWPEFTAPTNGDFAGYTPSQATVAANTVTAETKDVTITITYTNGNGGNVTPSTPTDADTHTPEGTPIKTPEGTVPDPADGIKNKDEMPDGTKYTWEDPDKVKDDVKHPGSHDETIVVTYPDGSQDKVTVPVIVPEPQPQPIHTNKGEVPDPADGIKNKDEMPDGTKYTWKDPDKVKDDVNKPGTHDETIVITYPDGTTQEITVPVIVEPEGEQKPNTTPTKPNNNTNVRPSGETNNGQNESVAPNAEWLKDHGYVVTVGANGEVLDYHKSANGQGKIIHKNTLPQTGAKQNTAGILGLAIAAVGSLFGLGATKKRRDE